jgi:DNA-binding NarL/FixJ family response regulator
VAIIERTQAEEIDLRVVEPGDGVEIFDQIDVDVPDVVVVSVDPGPVHPLRLCREVADRSPVTRVLVQAPPEQAANSYQALRVGAWGCIDPGAGPSELHEAAEAAARGEALLPSRHAGWVLRELDDPTEVPAGSPPTADRMTAAERTVLRLLAEGNDAEAIADHLGVTPRVVGRHAGSALTRLHRRYRRPSAATGQTSPAI